MQATGLRSFLCTSRAYFLLVSFVAGLCFSTIAAADPPSRVARLGYISGQVTFSPGGENDWTRASLNRPMTTGDRVWTDARSRTEVQMGGAMLRLDAFTGVALLNLDDQIAQVQLTQGVLHVNVRYLEPDQVFEIDTPNLAFVVRQPGRYLIDVDANAGSTVVIVRSGEGEAYGDNQSYLIDAQQPYRFTGTSLRDYQLLAAPRPDEFENWTIGRDRTYASSISARYVSPDVIGYQDLDANGNWRTDADYGNVWYPSRVAAGWAPYRDGHWSWIDPWGWTWVDDATWGFAVSHYGRWANTRSGWGWVPGPYSASTRGPRQRVYYAPALVAFVGGSNFQVTVSSRSVGGVGWFPLGPREVYRPSYAVSRGYFENINRSNTVVNTTVINNYYNNTNVTNVVYANRARVIAVPTATFVQSQPVNRAAVPVSRESHGNVSVAFAAPVAPTQQSVRGAAAQVNAPPARSFQRPVVARAAPPPARAGFAIQQQQLAAHPGMPLDDAARRQLKPTANAPVPVVKVVPQQQTAPPTARPPRGGPNERPGNGPDRGRPADGKAASPAPGTSPPTVLPGAAALPSAPAAAPQPPDQRGRDSRGKPDPRAPQPPVPAPAVQPLPPGARPLPAPAAPPAVRLPQAATPPAATPAAQPPVAPQDPRDRPDGRRGKGEPPQRTPPPPAAPATAPAPATANVPVPPPATAPAPRREVEPRGPASREPGNREDRRAPQGEPRSPAQAAPAPQAAQPRPVAPPALPPQAAPKAAEPRERAPEVAPRQPQPRPEAAPRPAPEQRQAPPPKAEKEKPAPKAEDNRNEKGKRDDENRKQKD